MSQHELTALAARLGSGSNAAGLALGELVRRGREAVPALLEALGADDATTRALAAEGLGMIADPAAAKPLKAAVGDPDGVVRSQAAAAMARLHDPAAIPALVATLNDYPDSLHADLSLSAYALAGQGTAALPAVVPLLTAPDEPTRAKSVWILRRIASDRFGREGDWRGMHALLDAYDPGGSPADQQRVAREVQRWIGVFVNEAPEG